MDTSQEQPQTKAVQNQTMDKAQFDEHMWKFNNYGFTLVSICFGNQLGLFDLMMEANRPMTSVQIADKADMKERYVREWLGSMVAAQIVLLDGDQYSIPPERHDSIKGATAWAGAALVWFNRFDQTRDCFRKNGPWGKDYDVDDQFWQVFDGFREKTGDDFMDKVILPCLDGFPQSGIKGKLGTCDSCDLFYTQNPPLRNSFFRRNTSFVLGIYGSMLELFALRRIVPATIVVYRERQK